MPQACCRWALASGFYSPEDTINQNSSRLAGTLATLSANQRRRLVVSIARVPFLVLGGAMQVILFWRLSYRLGGVNSISTIILIIVPSPEQSSTPARPAGRHCYRLSLVGSDSWLRTIDIPITVVGLILPASDNSFAAGYGRHLIAGIAKPCLRRRCRCISHPDCAPH
jgi:hypothetical protein